jgi:hypothetical protein
MERFARPPPAAARADVEEFRVIECDFCGAPFDPIATRWRCTACGGKANCCDGAPLPEEPVDIPQVFQKMAQDNADVE